MRLKEANLFFGSRLACLRNQKCTIYQNRIVTDEPQREANESYKALGFACPEEIPVKDGRMVYVHPEPGTLPAEKKTRKGKKKANKTSEKTVPSNQNTTNKNQQGSDKSRQPNGKVVSEQKETPIESDIVPPKRGRGRPKGSKNKKTLEREAAMAAQGITEPKKGKGRPKGSKNKKTLAREAAITNSR